jgi:hypothetical protein
VAIRTTPEPPLARLLKRPLLIAAAVVIAILGIVVIAATRSAKSTAGGHVSVQTSQKLDAELALADARIAAGRLVAPGGDEALDHLLAARTLDPTNPGVRKRFGMLARTFEHLADEAISLGSLAEAAAHLQTVLIAEPDNASAARKMADVEQQMLERQRAK